MKLKQQFVVAALAATASVATVFGTTQCRAWL
jgi:hypothetical protein